MSFWCDIHTTVFTPRDYQVELLSAAYERNVCICLGHKSSKEFIALKLLQETAKESRRAGKVSVYISRDGAPSMYTMIQNLTDLKVYQQPDVLNPSLRAALNKDRILEEDEEEAYDAFVVPTDYHVYILHPHSCLEAIRNCTLPWDKLHLMILEDCHDTYMHEQILPIFQEHYRDVGKKPKVLSLGGPLHSAGCMLDQLSARLQLLEQNLHCTAETASDIVTVLRYCAKPIELLVQCAPRERDELTVMLDEIINTRRAFLNCHRYDPSEIYNTAEFAEELKSIPDPKKEPMDFLDIMLSVLHEMGPWVADRVAVNMYHRIEKQKIKTPHERHFLLLCMVNTAISEIHAICEYTFRKFNDHKEVVERYSSPKVLRLLQVLRLFRPEEFASNSEVMKKISVDLESMDFQRLSRSIEYSCQNVENISKQQQESRSIIENLDPIVKPVPFVPVATEELIAPTEKTEVKKEDVVKKKPQKSSNSTSRRQYHYNGAAGRTKRRAFIRRQKINVSGDSLDTLCAIIYCDSNYTARALFDLLAEMTRHDADLKFLKCQYTTDRMADPISEPKEAEAEHRRQEEVLKRFRMHDCNVLIGTAVLEEGIDVPKCNLVVRWDAPTNYRSYVQCKGRARAAPAYHVVLVGHECDTSPSTATTEQLSDHSHKLLCQPTIVAADDDSINTTNSDSDSAVTKGCARYAKKQNSKIVGNGWSCSSEDDDDDDDADCRRALQSNCFTVDSTGGTVKILNPEVITRQPFMNYKRTDHDTSNSTKSNKIENSLLNCYEVMDLNEAILKQETNENELLNWSAHSSPRKEVKAKEKTKSKRRIGCVVDEDSLKQTNNNNSKEIYENELQRMQKATDQMVERLAQYREIEKILLRKCANAEPAENEHQLADTYTACVSAYKPLPQLLTGASVDLGSAIALVNKYCSKLPSDTFTKLTALWRCTTTTRYDTIVFQYTLRLPINSPLKYDIVGLPMGTHILARRMAALQTCIELHKSGELDDHLQPIGKEGFRAIEADWENFELEAQDERIVQDNAEPRPGTTKRRQYYYKRIASEFCDCRPTVGTQCYLYLLDLTLQCPIPEEQNTRGRKIYPPEDAQQGFGILTLKKIPKVSAFPIFTRSGEVRVSIELSKERIVLDESQIRCINTFVNYTFTNVLRLQKFLMLFDPDSTENCVFIVPTVKTTQTSSTATKVIDWQFLELIEQNASMMPTAVPEEKRKTLDFDANKFRDAVVMPWYRNQDQPQYFYVAEICPQLSPLSCFPGENYQTFKHYYHHKYSLNIQNTEQPLLDVDHTSARLNFLTPRYVNRKGVALPTSSEETKRAKRENLEQKQILVPELCTVHPFPASLWRTAVCLPCILYRINGLLLADDIRKKVSADIGLGQREIVDEFDWPMLDFGWSLSEVLKKSKFCKSSTTPEPTTAETETETSASNPTEDVAAQSGEGKSEEKTSAKSANEIVIEGERKLQDSSFIEIGTWSNEMANDINMNGRDYTDDDDEEYMKYLPSNVSFCDQQTRYGSPTFWDLKEANLNGGKAAHATGSMHSQSRHNGSRRNSFVYYDSDDSFESIYEGNPTAIGGCIYSSDDDDDDIDSIGGTMRIAFTSRNEAETIETEQEIDRRNKQLSIIQATKANERNYQQTKNMETGYNFAACAIKDELQTAVAQFVASTESLKKEIRNSGILIPYNATIELPKRLSERSAPMIEATASKVLQFEQFLCMLPYADSDMLRAFLKANTNILNVEDIYKLNAHYVNKHMAEYFQVLGSGDIFDNFNDKIGLVLECRDMENQKSIRLNFAAMQKRQVPVQSIKPTPSKENDTHAQSPQRFSFDQQPDLCGHPGPSPSIILQALTMSNANDGINLERLETIGDSFLKYAITTYLYITYENVHEGKLSHLRSKQVANLNLYRLGRRKMLGEYMIATKFEPHDNWLPPCYYVPKELEKALIEAKIPPHHWKLVDLPNIKKLSSAEICQLVREKADQLGLFGDDGAYGDDDLTNSGLDDSMEGNDFSCFIPYNLVTQHSIPDKSVADCVEALIGAYLIECGPRGALLFMAWLGIRVLPFVRQPCDTLATRMPGSTNPDPVDNLITIYGEWAAPKSPLLHYSPNAEVELETMLEGFDEFEAILGYKFRDRSYLLQAMTHASYSPNRLTDCYQRLEFLGDAVLDYLITRHLYEDPRQHSPGALTDLRSALVNNTIFASLAVRHGFHKYFRHLSPGLNEVIDRFVRIQNENGHSISEEYYLLSEEECDDAEDVEVPKALGDVFESIAGAIFLDSNMSLDVVWQVYSNMMKPEIEQFSNSVPKSPIRELLELEPETAKFGKPVKLADGRRVRVTVDVFCKGTFRGIGRNYRIAKCTAAKCALRALKKQGLVSKKE